MERENGTMMDRASEGKWKHGRMERRQVSLPSAQGWREVVKMNGEAEGGSVRQARERSHGWRRHMEGWEGEGQGMGGGG